MRFEDAYEGWTSTRLTQIDAAQLLGVCACTFRRTPATARRAGFNRYEEDGLAGLFAVLAAELAFWALQRFVLELDYFPTPALWLPTIVAAALLLGALGLWNCRRVVAVAPARVLREVGSL